MSAERVLAAVGRLQRETVGTPVEPAVTELLEAIAEDTTAVELLQKVAHLEAELEQAWRS